MNEEPFIPANTVNLRKLRKTIALQRKQAVRRFRKHKRKNLFAEPGVHDCAVVLDHLKQGYNVGKIIRSADAFGVREVHLVGIDFFDPAPAMGSFKWVPVQFHSDFDACYQILSDGGYTLFTLEPTGGESLMHAELPRKSAFVMGHEEYGISFDRADYPAIRSLMIPQFGKVESLNVSVAASIVLYEYVRQQVRSEKRPEATEGAR